MICLIFSWSDDEKVKRAAYQWGNFHTFEDYLARQIQRNAVIDFWGVKRYKLSVSSLNFWVFLKNH